MISRLSHGVVSPFAKRIPGLAAVATLALIFTALTQAQLKPALVDSTAARPSLTAKAEIPAGAQSVVSATLGKADEAYRAKSSGKGYATENPANHLAAQYAAAGVKIRWRNASMDLQFQGWGYGKAKVKEDPAAVAPVVDGNRVEFRRGALTEWYVNGPLGIEQGFTISQPPAAFPDSQQDVLDIKLRLGGNLSAAVEAGRHALTLRDQSGVQTLRYGPLLAYDASGRELESWMEVQDGSLRLRVNTTGARYPILVDPWVQAVELTVSSTLTGGIGSSGSWVAVSGNTVVVGAPGATVAGVAQGAVFVFVQTTPGSWAATSTYELTASNGVAGDDFGFSVGIDAGGDTIVVGAPQVGSASGATGVAYVFVEPTGGPWKTTSTYNAELTADDVSLFGEFGWSVGIDAGGDTVVVGAPFNPFLGYAVNEEPYSEIGEAYVFVEPTPGGVPTWSSETETAKLKASDGYGGDALGLSVGINESGNTVVAGAIDATIPPPPATGGNQYQGAVYVFVETGGVWATPTTPTTFNAKLFASDATADSHLGWSVGISGNTVVAGAYQTNIIDSNTGQLNAGQGAAYVFVDPGPTPSDWVTPTTPPTFNAKLTASDGAADDEFGTSVAISGSTVVVGAASTAGGVGTGASAAYVFVEPGDGWVPTPPPTQTQELLAPAAGDAFGNSVGISGNTIVVGAYGATNASGLAQGAAYVFANTTTGPYAQYSAPGDVINFGSVNVNSTATYTLTLTNTGSPAFTVSGISLSGASSAFSVTNVVCTGNGNSVSPPYTSMTVSLAQGDLCTITLQFAPTLVQNGQAEALTVATSTTNSNALDLPGGGQGYSLDGAGVEPIATFSPTQVNFGNVAENVPVTYPVTVTNTGAGTLILAVAGPHITGTAFSDPQYTCSQSGLVSTPSYPVTLNYGDSCTYTVQYDPTSLGPAQNELAFEDNAGPGAGESNLPISQVGPYFVQSVPLSGTGVTGIATTTTITSTTSSLGSYALPPGVALVGLPITVNFTVAPTADNPTGTVIVEDGFEEFCTPPGTLTSASNGIGSCPLTINGLGTGSTPLSAQYTPDAVASSNGLLGSATVRPLFTETVVEFTTCGPAPQAESVAAGVQALLTGNVCLASGLVGVDTVTAAVSSGCPADATCNVAVTPVTGRSGLYSVALTITTTGAGGIVPLQNHSPLTGTPSRMFLELSLLLAMMRALQLARRNRERPRFAYPAGLAIALAILLGGVNSCSSGRHETPANTYTINVTISAGAYNVTMPFTLTVTK